MYSTHSTRLLPAFLALLLPASVSAFSDVAAGNVYADAITYVQEESIVQGYADGTFRADATINRAEFTKIIVGATVKTNMDMHCFPDVKDEWFAPFVCTAKSKDIIGGYQDGTFKPGNFVNFVEGAKIIAKAFGLPSTAMDENWYTPFVIGLEQKNAIPTDIKTLTQPLTRGQMAEMIFRIKTQNTDKPTQTFEGLTGHAFVQPGAMSTSSKASSSKAAASAPARGAFPYNLTINANWQTVWDLQKIEGTAESLQNVTVETGDAKFPHYLRVHFPEGSVNRFGWKFYKLPLGGLYTWAKPAIEPQKNITLTYFIRIPVDFDYKGGGGLPGILTGMQNSRTEESGGSVDINWDKDGYITVWGEFNSVALVHKSNKKLPRDGKWHRIDVTARMQTSAGKSNGSIQVSLDGELITSASDIAFMNRTNDLWDGISMWAFLDANDVTNGPQKDLYIDFAGFSLDTP